MIVSAHRCFRKFYPTHFLSRFKIFPASNSFVHVVAALNFSRSDAFSVNRMTAIFSLVSRAISGENIRYANGTHDTSVAEILQCAREVVEAVCTAPTLQVPYLLKIPPFQLISLITHITPNVVTDSSKNHAKPTSTHSTLARLHSYYPFFSSVIKHKVASFSVSEVIILLIACQISYPPLLVQQCDKHILIALNYIASNIYPSSIAPSNFIKLAHLFASLPISNDAVPLQFLKGFLLLVRKQLYSPQNLICILEVLRLLHFPHKSYHLERKVKELLHCISLQLLRKELTGVLTIDEILLLAKHLAEMSFVHMPLLRAIADSVYPFLSSSNSLLGSKDIANKSCIKKDQIMALFKSYTILGLSGSLFYKPICNYLCNEKIIQLSNPLDCVTILQSFVKLQNSSPKSALKLKSMLLTRIEELFQAENVVKWGFLAYDLLLSMSNLQIRKQALLDCLLAKIEESFSSETKWRDKIQVAFHLYSLDIWNSSLMYNLLEAVKTCPENIFSLEINRILRLFLAFAYFSIGDSSTWEMLVQQILPREIYFDRNSLEILKMIELSLRIGHFPFSMASLSRSSRDFFLRIRLCKVPHQSIKDVGITQKELLDAAIFLSFDVYSGVVLGPYFLDFVKPLTSEEIDKLEEKHAFQSRATCAEKSLNASDTNTAMKLIQKGIIIEVATSHFFYDSTTLWTAQSKWKHALLTGLGLRYVRIPFYEWEPLSKLEKSAYLKHILDETCDKFVIV